MHYEDDQKGLFTFYREQAIFEDQIKQIQRENIKTKSIIDIKQKSNPKIGTRLDQKLLFREKSKDQQKMIKNDVEKEQKQKIDVLRKIGQTVVIVKSKEQLVNLNEKGTKQTNNHINLYKGRYIGNKVVSFQKPYEQPERLERARSITKRILKKVKNERQSNERVLNDRANDQLPPIEKVFERSYSLSNNILSQNVYKSKERMLKSNDGQLMKQIKSKIQIEREILQSVSFIQYRPNYSEISNGQSTKRLNPRQKRLICLLKNQQHK